VRGWAVPGFRVGEVPLSWLAGVFASVLVVAGAASADIATKPYCLHKADGFRQLAFRAADGQPLEGITVGRGRVGLVLGHMIGSDSCEWYDMAKVFARRGYRVLAIDFRGFGLSPPPVHHDQTALWADIGGAAAEVRLLGAKRVVAIGSSMGGTALVVAGARPAYHLSGIISISGAGDFYGMDALAASRQVTIPAFFMAAHDDGSFPANARAMERRAQSKHKALLILPGGTHGTPLLTEPDTARRAQAFLFAALHTIAAR